MLFDRALGVAAFAPWLFIAAAGVATVLRADRARLLPAAATIAASLAVLSLFRYWRAATLRRAAISRRAALASPFVAYGLARIGQRRCAPSLLRSLRSASSRRSRTRPCDDRAEHRFR